jgi:hypothetical protein
MGTHYQLFPKLIYGAAAGTHLQQKLEDAFKSIWYKLLPSLCVNMNITKEYRLVWAKKVLLAAICLVAGSASFGIQEN